MRILITGADGQLGQSLQDTAPQGLELIATDVRNLDLCDEATLRAGLSEHAPDVIINAAAYTAVDKAEAEPGLAHAVNAEAVAGLARHCAESGCKLIHVSTDFVFAGDALKPYLPDDQTQPASVYGKTKLAGERAALEGGCDARVVRTSWVYSEHGHNFVKTMLRLGADRDRLTVVSDQTGSPTYARNLAATLWRLLNVWPDCPVLHYADSGETSWQGFAKAIFADAAAAGLITQIPEVAPISTSDYGAPAPRPAYSVLDTSLTREVLGIEPPEWRSALREMLGRLDQ